MWYLIAIVLIFIVILLFLLIAIRFVFRVPKNLEKMDPGKFELDFQTISIPTVSQKRLFGWLLPVQNSTTALVILHGWGSNAEEMLPIALPFHQAGMNILLIDARNHGHSDRDSFSSLPKFAEDLEKAIGWLKSTYPGYSNKISLLGHSIGGAAVLLAASRRNDINAVISISTFAHPKRMMQHFLSRFHTPTFFITLIINYVEWTIGYHYEDIAPANTVCHVKCPILLVHGKIDTTVPVEDALIISSECKKSNIKLIIVEDAGHESIEKIKMHQKELVQFLKEVETP